MDKTHFKRNQREDEFRLKDNYFLHTIECIFKILSKYGKYVLLPVLRRKVVKCASKNFTGSFITPFPFPRSIGPRSARSTLSRSFAKISNLLTAVNITNAREIIPGVVR